METGPEIKVRDIPLDQLVPLQTRDIDFNKNAGFLKIIASIKSVGLIEPLAVYQKDQNSYAILDGYLRYVALEQLGERTAPCIIYSEHQAYSFNKNVNRLSNSQEIRMLRRSLETLDESTIAETFGLKSLSYRLSSGLMRNLHPEVVAAFEKDLIGKVCARELSRVLPARQLEILSEMRAVNNYKPALCRSLIVRTSMEQMNSKRRRRHPESGDGTRKESMVSRLEEAEKQSDFYSRLYRQYSADLLRVSFYVRKLLGNSRIEQYLQDHHPDVLTRFRTIVLDSPV